MISHTNKGGYEPKNKNIQYHNRGHGTLDGNCLPPECEKFSALHLKSFYLSVGNETSVFINNNLRILTKHQMLSMSNLTK
jgi:hypothetical protein